MNINNKKVFIFSVIKLFMAAVGIAAFFLYVDFNKFAGIFLHINLFYFFVALLLSIFYMFTAGCEWFYLIKSFGHFKIRLKHCLLYILEVQFYNMLLSNFTGDVIRHFKVYKHINNKKDVAIIFLMNKVYTCAFLAIFGGLSIFFMKTVHLSINPVIYKISGVMGIAAVLVIILSKKYRSFLVDFNAYKEKISRNLRFLLNALSINVLGRLVVVLIYYFICRSLNIQLTLLGVALVTFISAFGLLVPLNVAGLGAREGLNILLLVQFGISKERAISFSLVAYAIFVILSVAGGLTELSGYGWKFKKLKSEYRVVENGAIG